MFKIIDSHEHQDYIPVIKSFLQGLHPNESLEELFYELDDATFILALDEEAEIRGGAILLQKEVFAFPETIRNKLPKCVVQEGMVWTCAVSLDSSEDCFSPEYEAKFKKFYRDLYEEIASFGAENNLNYVCMAQEPGEDLCTEVIGSWPYVLKIAGNNARDNLSYAVLHLKKRYAEISGRSSWKTIASQVSKDWGISQPLPPAAALT